MEQGRGRRIDCVSRCGETGVEDQEERELGLREWVDDDDDDRSFRWP
jgi:hypothetical protein